MLLLTLCAEAQDSIGYYVSYRSVEDGITHLKTTSLAEVLTIVDLIYPNHCFNVKAVVKKEPYLFIDTYNKGVYIEMKRINKRGKYKRFKTKK
jgi:hypothetical protein